MIEKGQSKRRIAFALLPDEPGHLNAAGTLAKRLLKHGYDVSFVGLEDGRESVEALGFQYQVVALDVFPAGEWNRAKREASSSRGWRERTKQAVKTLKRLEQALQQFSAEIAGEYDLIIADGMLYYGPLVAGKAGIPLVLLQTSLPFANPLAPSLSRSDPPRLDGTLGFLTRLRRTRWGRAFNHGIGAAVQELFRKYVWRSVFGSYLQELERFGMTNRFVPRKMDEIRGSYPSLIACPKAFDFNLPSLPEHFYTDSLIADEEGNDGLDFLEGHSGPVLYASLGSQTWMSEGSRTRFYESVIELGRRKTSWAIVIAVGDRSEEFKSLPDNVYLLKWAPQRALLKRASVMITHAGLNTVKECIHNSVPMLCFPVGRDQPGNAARVKYHRLGLVSDLKHISTEEIEAMLHEVEINPIYRLAMSRMHAAFIEAEKRNDAVRMISELLDKRSMARLKESEERNVEAFSESKIMSEEQASL